jgi:uncharacterized membrane protein
LPEALLGNRVSRLTSHPKFPRDPRVLGCGRIIHKSRLQQRGLGSALKKLTEYFLIRLVAGLLIVAPIYLAIILLLKAMKSIAGLVKPFSHLVPAWLPADQVLSLLLVLVSCFFIGLAVRTPMGRAAWERMENSLFQRLPGYALIRSLTQRLAGETRDQAWKPALAEIEDALVPAFIIEELEDGRLTIFVPSVPTPLAGAVYILSADRVHALDIPFTQAVKVISRWGSGSKQLVGAMEPPRRPAAA